MILDTRKIHSQWTDFTFKLTDSELPRLLSDKAVREVNITAKIKIKKNLDQLDFTAEVAGNYLRACDSCLAEVLQDLQGNFSLTLLPRHALEFQSTKKELNLDQADIDTYHGYQITMDKYIEDYLILELPLYYKCCVDCAGLCQKCGQNLNEKVCLCDKKAP